MRNRTSIAVCRIVAGLASVACLTSAVNAAAQTPPPAAGSPPSAPAAAPHYVSIPLEIVVNRPVADVWARVGKYCDIGEWLQTACTIVSGKDGEIGTIRSIGSEILVGKSEFSYTYAQPPREGRPYNLYHGTIEARALTPTTTRLLYTLFYDDSMLADDAAREASRAQRATQFTRALENMKTLCEGGTLLPPPARGRGGAGAPGGRAN